jgi:hypothetical protein
MSGQETMIILSFSSSSSRSSPDLVRNSIHAVDPYPELPTDIYKIRQQGASWKSLDVDWSACVNLAHDFRFSIISDFSLLFEALKSTRRASFSSHEKIFLDVFLSQTDVFLS